MRGGEPFKGWGEEVNEGAPKKSACRERNQDEYHPAKSLFFERKRERARKRDEAYEKDAYECVERKKRHKVIKTQ